MSAASSSPIVPLPGDHRRIVIRMNEGETALRGDLKHPVVRLVQGVAVQDHLGPVGARVLHFHERRMAGHDDHGGHAQPLRVIGHRLAVIAGRHRADAAPALFGVELQQTVEGAALLERGGELQVLELDPQLGAGQARQRLAAQARRAADSRGDARLGGLDVGEGDAHAAILRERAADRKNDRRARPGGSAKTQPAAASAVRAAFLRSLISSRRLRRRIDLGVTSTSSSSAI